MLLFEIFSDGDVPYADLQVMEVMNFVKSGHRLKRPSVTTPEGIVELIRECTQMTVVKRPSMMVIEKWLLSCIDDTKRLNKFIVDEPLVVVDGRLEGYMVNAWVGMMSEDNDDSNEAETVL